MSAPTALKMGPLTNCVIPSKKHVLLMVIGMWFSLIPAMTMEYFYLGAGFNWNPLNVEFFQVFLDLLAMIEPWGRITIWLLFPFNILALHFMNAFFATWVSRFFLAIETRVYKPKEGIFPRDMKNPDYYHWNARRAIKKFPCWLLQLTPFTRMKRRFIYNKLGSGTISIGKNVGLLDAWIDTEFIDIGDNVAIGRSATITSHYFTPSHLIVKKVSIGANSLVGERARISPGAKLGEKTTILAKSVIRIDERVPDNTIFGGNPAQRVAWDA
jgi:acetyltransferase-like isoleucine patch superfamily enzyme